MPPAASTRDLWQREPVVTAVPALPSRAVELARPSDPVSDRLGRPLRSLRISVTDRCNLRCWYCMPEESYAWLSEGDRLSGAELERLIDAFVLVGVDGVHVTGGEPLLHRDLPRVIEGLARRPELRDVALTTNGALLQAHARTLRDAGLRRVTVSLDAVTAEAFGRMAGAPGPLLDRVLHGLDAAIDAGLVTKVNCVVIRGRNEDAVVEVLRHARDRRIEARFIEYMDVGGATRWSADDVVSRDEIVTRIERAFGTAQPIARAAHATAERFALPDGTTFGIIASVTRPFCGDCDRGRLTADGRWLLCLYDEVGTDLRASVRGGASVGELAELIAGSWRGRALRGAEDRARVANRGVWISPERLRRSPHLEMHTRGG